MRENERKSWTKFAEGKTSERNTQAAILDWLAAQHILAFRMNVGVFNVGGRTIRAGVPGMADILAFPRVTYQFQTADGLRRWKTGFPCPTWIECKSSNGNQSPLQMSFEKRVKEDGHRYILARSLEDVMELDEACP